MSDLQTNDTESATSTELSTTGVEVTALDLQTSVDQFIANQSADAERKLKDAPNPYWVTYHMGRQDVLRELAVILFAIYPRVPPPNQS